MKHFGNVGISSKSKYNKIANLSFDNSQRHCTYDFQLKTLCSFYSHIERSNMGDVGLSLRRHFSPSHIKW